MNILYLKYKIIILKNYYQFLPSPTNKIRILSFIKKAKLNSKRFVILNYHKLQMKRNKTFI